MIEIVGDGKDVVIFWIVFDDFRTNDDESIICPPFFERKARGESTARQIMMSRVRRPIGLVERMPGKSNLSQPLF